MTEVTGLKVRILKTVRGIGLISPPGTILREGTEAGRVKITEIHVPRNTIRKNFNLDSEV